MIDHKLFLKALRKAVPPTSDANKAVGGLLITVLNETEKLHAEILTLKKNLLFVAKDVGEVKAGTGEPAQQDVEGVEGGGEEGSPDGAEAPDDDGGGGNSTPIPAAMRTAMDAANVDQKTGESTEEPAPAPTTTARSPRKAAVK